MWLAGILYSWHSNPPHLLGIQGIIPTLNRFHNPLAPGTSQHPKSASACAAQQAAHALCCEPEAFSTKSQHFCSYFLFKLLKFLNEGAILKLQQPPRFSLPPPGQVASTRVNFLDQEHCTDPATLHSIVG